MARGRGRGKGKGTIPEERGRPTERTRGRRAPGQALDDTDVTTEANTYKIGAARTSQGIGNEGKDTGVKGKGGSKSKSKIEVKRQVSEKPASSKAKASPHKAPNTSDVPTQKNKRAKHESADSKEIKMPISAPKPKAKVKTKAYPKAKGKGKATKGRYHPDGKPPVVTPAGEGYGQVRLE